LHTEPADAGPAQLELDVADAQAGRVIG